MEKELFTIWKVKEGNKTIWKVQLPNGVYNFDRKWIAQKWLYGAIKYMKI